MTRRVPDEGLDLLRAEIGPFAMNEADRALTPDELRGAVRGRDGVLSLLSDRVDEAVLEAAGPACKVFANFAVGYNNVDVPAATARGIAITNTPGVLTETTADLAFTLILSVARRVVEGDRCTRTGAWKGWGPMQFLGRDLAGRTLGILGAGRIGRATARRGVGFGMKILYAANTAKPDFERETGAQRRDLHGLLAESDFVSVHVPLGAETTRLIGEPELRAMKPDAILINTARGPVVDEAALVRALAEGWIAGAGLDVYEHEPALAPGLAAQTNTVLLPHVGSATHTTRGKMARMAAENLIAVLKGETPPNCVNLEVFTRPA